MIITTTEWKTQTQNENDIKAVITPHSSAMVQLQYKRPITLLYS